MFGQLFMLVKSKLKSGAGPTSKAEGPQAGKEKWLQGPMMNKEVDNPMDNERQQDTVADVPLVNNRLTKIPCHLEAFKTNRVYNKMKFERLNKRSKSRAGGSIDGFRVMSLSELHLNCATGLLYTAAMPERAYAHMRLWLYYGVKDIARKLLPASDSFGNDKTAEAIVVNVYGTELICPALPQRERFYYITDWFEYFYGALLFDNQQDLQFLAKCRFDPLFDWADESQKLYSDLIAGFFNIEEHDLKQKYQAFIAASERGTVNDTSFVHTSRIKLPVLEVIQEMLSGDEQAYRVSMHRALTQHYEFWRQDKLKGDTAGDISVPLTAMARVAYQRFGYTLGFENDYVPEYFYRVDNDIAQQPLDFGPFEPLPEPPPAG